MGLRCPGAYTERNEKMKKAKVTSACSCFSLSVCALSLSYSVTFFLLNLLYLMSWRTKADRCVTRRMLKVQTEVAHITSHTRDLKMCFRLGQHFRSANVCSRLLLSLGLISLCLPPSPTGILAMRELYLKNQANKIKYGEREREGDRDRD